MTAVPRHDNVIVGERWEALSDSEATDALVRRLRRIFPGTYSLLCPLHRPSWHCLPGPSLFIGSFERVPNLIGTVEWARI